MQYDFVILGGTGLQGPDQVRYAVARGHKVTTFNRGRTNAGILNDLKDVVQLTGDRAPKPGRARSLPFPCPRPSENDRTATSRG